MNIFSFILKVALFIIFMFEVDFYTDSNKNDICKKISEPKNFFLKLLLFILIYPFIGIILYFVGCLFKFIGDAMFIPTSIILKKLFKDFIDFCKFITENVA